MYGVGRADVSVLHGPAPADMKVNKVREPCCQPELMQLAIEVLKYEVARILYGSYVSTRVPRHTQYTKHHVLKFSLQRIRTLRGVATWSRLSERTLEKSKKAIGIHLVRGTRHNPGFNGGDQFRLQDY